MYVKSDKEGKFSFSGVKAGETYWIALRNKQQAAYVAVRAHGHGAGGQEARGLARQAGAARQRQWLRLGRGESADYGRYGPSKHTLPLVHELSKQPQQRSPGQTAPFD
jgi:hypothetical protein